MAIIAVRCTVVDTLDRRPQAHNKYIKTKFTGCSEDDAMSPLLRRISSVRTKDQPPSHSVAARSDAASRQLTSIEINGTYYRTQKPESFARWYEETPENFVFALNGPMFTPPLAQRSTKLWLTGDCSGGAGPIGIVELEPESDIEGETD
jgi:hypothetical protein